MIEIPYTQKNLLRCVGYKDILADKSLLDTESRLSAVKVSLEKIKNKTAFHNALRPVLIASKKGYVFTGLQSELISRLVAKNIKVNYKIKQSDRQTVIANAISLLKEGGAYDVYRFDIKNFYENVDRKLVLQKLISDAKCSWQTLRLVSELFEAFEVWDIQGLPRGLGVSSALSELALSEFDAKIRHMPEVFYYGRFVDDILIITSANIPRAVFEKELSECLFQGLEFHGGGKRNYLAIPRSRDDVGRNEFQSFDFLGYEFKVFSRNESDFKCGFKRRKLLIDLSSSKVEKIKSRLINSFCSYMASAKGQDDYAILKFRVMALAGNYYITDPISGINIKTGIYYNYVHKNFAHRCTLSGLDGFLHGLLFSKTHSLSQRICRSLTLQQRRQLAGYSFVSGFVGARFHSFTYQVLKTIKECWRK
ncbi:antiviral reverse transcriptase Drt3a [Pseudomonas sp. PDM01]|uniref:antiviral reverse transcriptase Drt3a n=1 Tax=Pseudomonas sp. PDM01 TaxID=2769268 RepID=UPI001781BD40|nr:antiviral reverse transcriptase Drt3a [Pseudomonas sp. PDM01]MBD9548326.1 RNA-directed DNA polymerase [Pseudomonas sp. PDM01]